MSGNRELARRHLAHHRLRLDMNIGHRARGKDERGLELFECCESRLVTDFGRGAMDGSWASCNLNTGSCEAGLPSLRYEQGFIAQHCCRFISAWNW